MADKNYSVTMTQINGDLRSLSSVKAMATKLIKYFGYKYVAIYIGKQDFDRYVNSSWWKSKYISDRRRLKIRSYHLSTEKDFGAELPEGEVWYCVDERNAGGM